MKGEAVRIITPDVMSKCLEYLDKHGESHGNAVDTLLADFVAGGMDGECMPILHEFAHEMLDHLEWEGIAIDLSGIDIGQIPRTFGLCTVLQLGMHIGIMLAGVSERVNDS